MVHKMQFSEDNPLEEIRRNPQKYPSKYPYQYTEIPKQKHPQQKHPPYQGGSCYKHAVATRLKSSLKPSRFPRRIRCG